MDSLKRFYREVSPLEGIRSNGSASGYLSSGPEADTPNGIKVGIKPKPPRRVVACRSCHSLKVRCTPSDENDPAKPCIRCLNSGRKCEINLSQTRKRRKKADIEEEKDKSNSENTKLREEVEFLHSQVRALKLQLGQKDTNGPKLSAPDTDDSTPNTPYSCLFDMEKDIAKINESDTFKINSINGYLKTTSDRRTAILRVSGYHDLIDDGVITVDDARKRLELYKSMHYSFIPFIRLPENTTIESLRKEHPFLFLAIMAVTNCSYAGPVESDTALTIDICAVRSIAVEILVAGSKSVELIKALILLNIWYNTPEIMRNRRYHMLNSLSVSLLHDLGVNGNPEILLKKSETVTLEYRRLTLILYVITVNICIMLKRTIYVKWSTYVDESCHLLLNSKDNGDLQLAVLARLCYQVEKIQNIVHVSDVKERHTSAFKYVISQFQQQLTNIKRFIPTGNHSLFVFYYTVEAYLYEPVVSASIHRLYEHLNEVDTPMFHTICEAIVFAVTKCANSCMRALHEFNSLSCEEAAVMPLLHLSRLLYSLGILLRLRYTIFILPLNIKENMVPEESIDHVLNFVRKVDETSSLYPVNYLIRKTRLVLQLFIQTYVAQVQGLVGNEIRRQSVLRKPSISQIEKLRQILKDQGDNTAFNTFINDSATYHASPYSLDLLSYAASFRKDTQAASNTDRSKATSNTTQRTDGSDQAPSAQLAFNSSLASDLNQLPINSNGVKFYNQAPSPKHEPSDQSKDSSVPLDNNGVNFTSNFNGSPPVLQSIENPIGMGLLGTVNSSQLEDYYSSLNDEFWSDLINTSTNRINFSNVGSNYPTQDDLFFT